MSEKELLVFSENQQHAIIGHALQQPQVWDLLREFGVDEKWLVSNSLADTWKSIKTFQDDFDRYPLSKDELVDSVTDSTLQGAIGRSLEKCVQEKKKHPWDALEKKLVEWAKSRAIFVGTMEIAVAYNAGKHADAYRILQEKAIQLEKIEAMAGLEPDSFVSSAERMVKEEERRINDSSNIVPYGIPFLQDSLGGMLPTDVVLWGATSGAGKTEAAKIQAEHAASSGLPVHYFALEAEPEEIERRIKYGIVGAWYKNDHPGTPEGMICYKNFRLNRLNEEFSPYKKRLEEEYSKYKTLNTYYRKRGDFGLKEMDREIYKLKGRSKLVIIDHIHFMDMETDNEVREMSDLIKRIRQISGSLEIPIICVAHINKQGNRDMGLVPRKEDFYGAGNLFKTATTAIMMSPAYGLVSADSRVAGKPTFFRIVKCRIDGSLLGYTGVSYFNTWTSNYTPYYSVGRLERGDKKWKSLKGDLPYWVNIEKNIVDVSDIE